MPIHEEKEYCNNDLPLNPKTIKEAIDRIYIEHGIVITIENETDYMLTDDGIVITAVDNSRGIEGCYKIRKFMPNLYGYSSTVREEWEYERFLIAIEQYIYEMVACIKKHRKQYLESQDSHVNLPL